MARLVGVVSHVHDGDSIDVTRSDGTVVEVRLVGVNAPETGECHHGESTDYLTDLIRGREVELTMTGTDQFGRVLAHAWSGDVHVNLDLVADGHAIATTPQQGDPYGETLLDAESAAAERGLGLWGDHACGATAPMPAVTIHEIEANPPGNDEDMLDGERVVIANDTTQPVDFSGWVIRDESSRHRYRFGEATTLDPGERLTVTAADPGWDPGGSPVWNNDGDMAMLLDRYGRVVSAARY